MVITSSAIFEKLSKKYKLTFLKGGADNIPVRMPMLLAFDKPEPGTLYICEWDDSLRQLVSDGCAYLFLSSQVPQGFKPPDGCDAAVVHENISAIKLLYEVFDQIQKLQKWDLRLSEACTKAESLSQIWEAGRSGFDYPFAIVDRNFNIVEFTQDLDLGFDGERLPGGVKIPLDRVNELLLEPDFAKAEEPTDVFPYPFNENESRWLCVNIQHEGRYLARILAVTPRKANPGIRYLFGHMCRYICKAYVSYTDDVLVKHQNDRLHQLFKRLLFNVSEVRGKVLSDVIENYGWSLQHEYTVNVIRLVSHKEHDIVSLYLCSHLEKDWPDSCAIRTDDEIVWVVNHSLSKPASAGVAFSLAFVYMIRDLCCKAGISAKFNLSHDLSVYYMQAKAALEIGSQKDPHLWYYRFSNYTLDYMLSRFSEGIPKKQLCEPGLIKLLEADGESGGDLVKVLYYYIDSHYNTSLAADRIFVHRSTFIRQLERIRTITGVNWSGNVSMDTLFHTLVSFKMLDISYQ